MCGDEVSTLLRSGGGGLPSGVLPLFAGDALHAVHFVDRKGEEKVAVGAASTGIVGDVVTFIFEGAVGLTGNSHAGEPCACFLEVAGGFLPATEVEVAGFY